MALALGKTVEQLGREMSSHELSQWMALYQIEPFGDERADLRAGIVASTIVNCTPRKDHRQYRPAEFMPRWGGGKKSVRDPDQKLLKKQFAEMKRKMGQ